MTRFVLVRHGQTDWNRVERFRGRADVPLNASGLSQAEATARRVAREWRPVAIYASPLSRAFATAEPIGRQTHLAVTRLDGVIDIDYGVWEGLTPDEVFGRWPDLLYAWYNAPHTAQPPGGESLAALRERAMQSIDELAARHGDATVAIVSHTVVNRIILLAILGLGIDRFWRIRQDNCGINVFESESGDFTLLTLNDSSHVRGIA